MVLADDVPVSATGLRTRLRLGSARAVLIVLVLMVAASGVRRAADGVFPQYFFDLIAGHSARVSPEQGYLFEGMLGDAIAFCFVGLIHDASAAAFAWWAVGVALLCWATVLLRRSMRIPVELLCIVLLCTHLVDSLLLWMGKLDPILLAALVLSAHPSRRLSTVGAVTAPLLHPSIAVLSVVGTCIAAGSFEDRVRREQIIICIAVAAMDLLAFSWLFPDLRSRSGYFHSELLHIFASGMNYGVPTLLAGCAGPFALLYILLGQPTLRFNGKTLLFLAWLGSVVFASSFLILDHTRDLCLITTVPILVYVREIVRRNDIRVAEIPYPLLLCALVIRLSIPHIDGSGPEMFKWGIVLKQLPPP